MFKNILTAIGLNAASHSYQEQSTNPTDVSQATLNPTEPTFQQQCYFLEYKQLQHTSIDFTTRWSCLLTSINTKMDFLSIKTSKLNSCCVWSCCHQFLSVFTYVIHNLPVFSSVFIRYQKPSESASGPGSLSAWWPETTSSLPVSSPPNVASCNLEMTSCVWRAKSLTSGFATSWERSGNHRLGLKTAVFALNLTINLSSVNLTL